MDSRGTIPRVLVEFLEIEFTICNKLGRNNYPPPLLQVRIERIRVSIGCCKRGLPLKNYAFNYTVSILGIHQSLDKTVKNCFTISITRDLAYRTAGKKYYYLYYYDKFHQKNNSRTRKHDRRCRSFCSVCKRICRSV